MFGLFGPTFDPTKDIPDLSGKVILITGGRLHHEDPHRHQIQCKLSLTNNQAIVDSAPKASNNSHSTTHPRSTSPLERHQQPHPPLKKSRNHVHQPQLHISLSTSPPYPRLKKPPITSMPLPRVWTYYSIMLESWEFQQT